MVNNIEKLLVGIKQQTKAIEYLASSFNYSPTDLIRLLVELNKQVENLEYLKDSLKLKRVLLTDYTENR